MNTLVRQPAPGDVDDIHRIITHYAGKGSILPRERDEVRRSLSHFLVAEHRGSIAGIVSYYDYGSRLKEIRTLAVREDLRRHGIGTVLVRGLVELLRQDFPGAKIFVLTTTPAFFTQLGFIEVDRDSLPEKIWKDCQYCAHRDNCDETALTLAGDAGSISSNREGAEGR